MPRIDPPDHLDRVAKTQHEAAWPDVEAKAKRLVQNGQVILHRNGYNNIVATVQGDHGVYTVEIGRDDPASRAITTWTCECPWDQYAWGRTRQWKKYEGRVCSHALATYWKSLTTPLDEPPPPGQTQAPGEAYPVVQKPEQLAFDLDDAQEQAPAEAFPPESPETSGDFDEDQVELEEPATMQDLTIPNQPAVKPQDKQLMPKVNPYINQPMFLPPDPRQQQMRLFNFPGTLSMVYPHLANIDRIPIYAARNDLPRILEMIAQGKTPVAQVINPVWGEFHGGKIPVPGAIPNDYFTHSDGSKTPLYHYTDLGWDPETQTQVWPRRHGPEETGRMGEIPPGARVEIWDADPTTGYLTIAWSTPFGKLQHHLIRAFCEADDVRLVAAQTPFIRRR